MGKIINSKIIEKLKYTCHNVELVQAFIDFAHLIDCYDYAQRRAGLQDTGYLEESQNLVFKMGQLKEHLEDYAGIKVTLDFDPRGYYGKKLTSIKFDFSNWSGE